MPSVQPSEVDGTVEVLGDHMSGRLDIIGKAHSLRLTHCCWSSSELHEGARCMHPSWRSSGGMAEKHPTPCQEFGNPGSQDSFSTSEKDDLSKAQTIPVPQTMDLKNEGKW